MDSETIVLTSLGIFFASAIPALMDYAHFLGKRYYLAFPITYLHRYRYFRTRWKQPLNILMWAYILRLAGAFVIGALLIPLGGVLAAKLSPGATWNEAITVPMVFGLSLYTVHWNNALAQRAIARWSDHKILAGHRPTELSTDERNGGRERERERERESQPPTDAEKWWRGVLRTLRKTTALHHVSALLNDKAVAALSDFAREVKALEEQQVSRLRSQARFNRINLDEAEHRKRVLGEVHQTTATEQDPPDSPDSTLLLLLRRRGFRESLERLIMVSVANLGETQDRRLKDKRLCFSASVALSVAETKPNSNGNRKAKIDWTGKVVDFGLKGHNLGLDLHGTVFRNMLGKPCVLDISLPHNNRTMTVRGHVTSVRPTPSAKTGVKSSGRARTSTRVGIDVDGQPSVRRVRRLRFRLA